MDKNSAKPARQHITLDDGTEAWSYPDGSIRNDKGHWITRHPAGHLISKADASTLAHRKHAKTQESIERNIVERALERGITAIADAPDAIGHAYGVLYRDIVLDDDQKARDRRETLRDIAQAGDFIADRRAGAGPAAPGGVSAVSDTVLLRALQMIAERRDVVEGVARDAE